MSPCLFFGEPAPLEALFIHGRVTLDLDTNKAIRSLERPVSLGDMRILLAQSDRRVAERLEGALCAYSMEVIPVFDGIQALDVLASGPVDGLVIDVDLALLDGLQLLLRLRTDECFKGVPAVLTGGSLPWSPEEAHSRHRKLREYFGALARIGVRHNQRDRLWVLLAIQVGQDLRVDHFEFELGGTKAGQCKALSWGPSSPRRPRPLLAGAFLHQPAGSLPSRHGRGSSCGTPDDRPAAVVVRRWLPGVVLSRVGAVVRSVFVSSC